MVRDLGAECLPLVRVSNRRITRSANHSRGAGGHSKPSLLERKHRDLKTFAFFADQILFWHAYVLERKVSSIAGANAELAVDCSRSESFHTTLNDETGHSCVIPIPSFLFVCPAKEKKIVGSVGETDPHLLAVQNVLIAFAPSRGARAHDVRSGAWLSQSVSPYFLPFV